MKLRDITESFKHYTVKHKRTGKTYKVTAMHDNSAKEKARVQHGGTASRYTGTSTDDFEIVEAVNEIAPVVPIVGGALARQGAKQGAKQIAKNMMKRGAGGQVARNVPGDSNKAVYSIEVNGALVHSSPSFTDIDRRIWKLINGVAQGPKGKLGLSGAKKIDPKQIQLKRNGVKVPHKYRGGEKQPITGPITEADNKNPYNSFGLKAYKTTEDGKDVYISVMKGKVTGEFPTLGDLKMHQQEIIRTFMEPLTDDVTFESLEESVGQPITEAEFDRLAEKKDACYHKVKSRYKVWPSAYASGALVQCRKKGAANWGNKSKK